MAAGTTVVKIVWVPNKAGQYVLLKSPAGDVGRYMARIGRRITAMARVQAGVDTGALKASIRFSQSVTPTGQEVKIGSMLGHALVHHEGSRPHIITGRNGGMLRFTKQSRVIYTRAVVHPGTKPNKYLSDNLWIVRA